MLFLLLGLLILWLSSELFVNSSCKIAKEFHMPKYIIGIVITSLGTSLPELVLSVYGALTSHVDMVIGNIVGSNIANIALGLGLLSLLARKQFANNHLDFIKTDQNYLLLSTIFILFGCYFVIFNWILGILALIVMALFLREQFKINKDTSNNKNLNSRINYKNIVLDFGLVLLASFLIYLGAKWTIMGGVELAQFFNVPEFIIGLITVALGTSLPEIAVVITACRKGEESLALGNIIGSNIYNVCFILGLTSVITPLTFGLQLSSPIIIYLSILSLVTCYCLKYIANKLGGLILISSYITFVILNFYL